MEKQSETNLEELTEETPLPLGDTERSEEEKQMDLFDKPQGAVKRLDKRASKGKKITRSDAVNATLEMRQMMNAIVGDLQKLAMGLEHHDMALRNVFSSLNCLIDLLVKKEVFTEEEFRSNWVELVQKANEAEVEAKKKELVDKMKADGVAAVDTDQATSNEETDQHPDCNYCGQPDCDFCNKLLSEDTERDIEEDNKTQS